MAYKTLFTALTEFAGSAATLDYASALAEAQDAHLETMALGIDRTPTYYEIGSNTIVMHAAIEEAHARADEMHARLLHYLEATNLRWDVLNGISSAAGVGRTVAVQARFCDLAITGLPYGQDSKAEDCLILEGLLFEADCPTIVVPDNPATVRPETIVIGWNESPEAMRAVKAALPFLKAAKSVHIAIVDPPETGPERSDPGGALAIYLSRHGIKSDIHVMTRQGLRVSERLNQHVTETGAEMLIMGGYGHSRFREAVLGGATREMLQYASVPVLMAH